MARTPPDGHLSTLDLRQPTRRAVDWLQSTDPQTRASTPGQGWWHAWGYGDVTGRMVEAFALSRRVLGQSDVSHQEERCRQLLEGLFDGSNGLSWRPETPHRRLAEGLTRFVIDHSGVFEPDGSYLERASRAAGHVHSRLATAAGVLQLGALAVRDDWMAWARTVLDWSMAHVASSFGWISERAHSMDGGCETCCLTDALDLAVGLAESGQPQYWDLAERIARNHLLESQCPDTGGISGHTMPSDYCWVHPAAGQPEHHVGGCCSPAGVRALWRVWDRVAVRQGDTTFIHLSLDRHAPWATVVSALPWEGRVAVTVHQPGDLMLRIPPWVCADAVRLSVNGAMSPFTWTAPYVRVRDAAAGDCVEVTYPVPEERRTESVMGRQYEVTWRGSTVLAVEPAGSFEPLYRRRES